RLAFIAARYLRTRRDGMPPLTPIEAQLLDALRHEGLSPMTQFGIGRFRVDFAFPSRGLAVEADGRPWHDAERDAARDAHLRNLGWEVLRFSGSEIHRDASRIAKGVADVLENRNNSVTYSEL